MMEDNIFKLLKSSDNEQLSKLKGIDLLDIIAELNDCYLVLRNELDVDKSITFGTELEFEKANMSNIESDMSKIMCYLWTIKGDASLNHGGEVVSPILNDSINNWNDLDKVCNIIKNYASIGDHSGGHVHIGTQTLGNEKTSWLNFIKLWSTYENIIYRFVYGEFLNARPSMHYAEPMSKVLWNDYETLSKSTVSLENILSHISHQRYQAVNFYNVKNFEVEGSKNTIEFRCPNGSLESIVWQNNINLFIKILLYSKSNLFNNDIIDRRHNIIKDLNIKYYNEIFLDQALEFCDLIFDNNEDKIYFLKQYLKSFEVSNNNDFKKSNNFTKKLIIKKSTV